MTVFADSSAVVKLYSREPQSERLRALEAMYVSQIASVEIPAALWRKRRMGELDEHDCRILLDAFESDYFSIDGRLVPALISTATLDRAAQLSGAHGLRAYDAVQLASALEIRSIDPDCRTFAAFDVELLAAAQREGFSALPE